MNLSRIKDNVRVSDSGCWIWVNSLTSSGYGQLTEDGSFWTAHRYAYTCVNGDIPEGLLIRHLCGNPSCCNPDHLLEGTSYDNWKDSELAYRSAAKARRCKWNIEGISYSTSREAVTSTGISISSIIKYTIDGVFDSESYRAACIKANCIPKI